MPIVESDDYCQATVFQVTIFLKKIWILTRANLKQKKPPISRWVDN